MKSSAGAGFADSPRTARKTDDSVGREIAELLLDVWSS
jgi:hypothetical protein